MKLSEAIRIGATMVPGQNTGGGYFSVDGSACAIGAACLAIGKIEKVNERLQLTDPLMLGEWFPILNRIQSGILFEKNDKGKQTFEQIAQYVESFEREEEQTA